MLASASTDDDNNDNTCAFYAAEGNNNAMFVELRSVRDCSRYLLYVRVIHVIEASSGRPV